MTSAPPDLERRYAALRAKKAAAAGADAATVAPAKTSAAGASATTSTTTGLSLIAPLHGLTSLSPSVAHQRSSSASANSCKPLISVTPKSLTQSTKASSSQTSSVIANKRQKTNAVQPAINAPSPYGEQTDTIKRKKRPGASQAAAASTSTTSSLASSNSTSPHPSAICQQPTIRILPLAATKPSADTTRIPRSSGVRESSARSDIDLSSTSHLATYTTAVPTLSIDTLHVSNLPDSVTEQQLHAVFSPYGVIQSVTVLSARSSPLAFVHFAFPSSAQQALTALHDRPVPSLSPQPLYVQFARKKDASGRGGGGSNQVSTYEALERELAGSNGKAGGGASEADDGDSFDVTLLAWRPDAAKMAGLTTERAVRVRRRCTRLGESMREATEGMYVMPTEEDAVQPDREPIGYDDLSTPYA